MSVIIHEGQRPVLNLTLVAGGDLDIGVTYYFIGITGNNYGYYGGTLSPASLEYSITTDATHRSINIDWGVLTAPFERIKFKWDTSSMLDGSGNYIEWGSDVNYGHRKWTHYYYSNGWNGTNKTITKSDLHDNYNSRGFNHLEIANNPKLEIDNKIGKDKGRVGIEITNTNTITDLLTAIDGSGVKDLFIKNYNSLTMFAFMYGYGNITIENYNLIFLYGTNISKSIFNNCNLTFENYWNIWNKLYGTYKNCKIMSNGFRLQVDEIDSMENSCISGSWFVSFKGNSGLILTDYKTNGQVYPTVDYAVFSNMIFNNSYLEWVFRFLAVVDKVHHWDNFKFNNNNASNYDFYLHLYPANFPTYKTKLYLKNVTSDRSDGMIVTKRDDLGSYYPDFNFYIYATYDIDFKITNKDGVGVENATITIVDKDGTIYTGNTDINGEVTILNILKYTNEYDPTNANGYYSKNTLKEPFNLTIEKYGYVKYVSNNLTTNKFDKIVALTELIPPTITFTTTDDNIPYGGNTTLSWNVNGADTITINEGIGSVNSINSLTVSPLTTTTYILTAENMYGISYKEVKINVEPQIIQLPYVSKGKVKPFNIKTESIKVISKIGKA